jgi:processive 1,2-diacylglycerol beta-glucosyltransferase
MKKKIVYLTASMGSGHNAAVNATFQAVEKYFPGKYEQDIIDVYSLLSPSVAKVAASFYENSSKYSKFTWKSFFEITDRTEVVGWFDKKLYPLLKKPLGDIAAMKPDLIFSCYPFLSYSVAHTLKMHHIKAPFLTLLTDTGEVHSAWISDGVDEFIAPTKETAQYLVDRGIKPEKIHALGFPVAQSFYKPHSHEYLRTKFRIHTDQKVILYFTGIFGMGNIAEKITALDKSMKDITILVVSGKNKTIPKQLKSMKFRNDVRALGFVDGVGEMMAVADLVITKAGGMSVMEVVTMKKPAIIAEVIPGQEEPNAEFIESMGFGYIEKTTEGLVEKARFILETDDIDRINKNYGRYHLNEHSDMTVASLIDYKLR